jgi:hypothetical protein
MYDLLVSFVLSFFRAFFYCLVISMHIHILIFLFFKSDNFVVIIFIVSMSIDVNYHLVDKNVHDDRLVLKITLSLKMLMTMTLLR